MATQTEVARHLSLTDRQLRRLQKLPGAPISNNGPAVADEFDNPTTDIRKDRCSKCMRGCEMRGMVANFGGFLSINKLSQ